MTEQELRILVRAAIARQRGVAPHSPANLANVATVANLTTHASHALFVVPDGSDADGPCIIEPAVMCNHCGYCKSLGH
jgi:hypothetical protein